MSHTKRLRDLLTSKQVLQAPGVHDGLTALLVEQAGFPLAFLSGASLAFARFGRPDLGLIDMTEVAQTVRIIRDRISIPLIVDADTGFGNALNVQRTVREFEAAGASAIQIEDQVTPKRCGHMQGKQVVPVSQMLGKIKAAVDARRDTNLIIIARTDALAVEGFNSSVERAAAYLDAGADALFIEGPREIDQMKIVGQQFAHVPLVHNLVEGGHSPVHSGAELAQFGYRIALHPAMLVHLFAKIAPLYLKRLAAEGSTNAFRGELLDLEGINALLGTPQLLETSNRYA
jgi:2-methylisocitrate lyase-like PEP mutase family enzyme